MIVDSGLEAIISFFKKKQQDVPWVVFFHYSDSFFVYLCARRKSESKNKRKGEVYEEFLSEEMEMS